MIKNLEPVFKPTLPRFDPRSFVTELICSEAFIVTSPANLSGMAYALQATMQRWSRFPFTIDNLKNNIAADIIAFGESSSLSNPLNHPRTTLLIPAMPPRPADYASLGKAGYL